MTQICLLESRALLSLGGEEAVSFLQNLVTCDVENLSTGDLAFGALLTPQGKVLFDFFLLKTTDGFLLDCPDAERAALQKRLMFYRLRAAVTIETDERQVFAAWGGTVENATTPAVIDPRNEALGYRIYTPFNEAPKVNATESDWNSHRIALGVAQSGSDFESGSVFPHDVLMDQDGSIGFTKGCYVGQEVVSRMQHRGTARSRLVRIASKSGAELPPLGASVMTGEKIIGTMGSRSGANGLAIIRVDRFLKAKDDSLSVSVEGVKVDVILPDFLNPSAEG